MSYFLAEGNGSFWLLCRPFDWRCGGAVPRSRSRFNRGGGGVWVTCGQRCRGEDSFQVRWFHPPQFLHPPFFDLYCLPVCIALCACVCVCVVCVCVCVCVYAIARRAMNSFGRVRRERDRERDKGGERECVCVCARARARAKL